MVAERQTWEFFASEPLDFTRGGGEPVLTSTAFAYTRKSTAGFFFLVEGAPINIGANTQTSTA